VAARGDLARCELTTKLTSPSQSTPEDEQRQIEFQLYGAIAATSAVVPAMQEASTGTLLYTTAPGPSTRSPCSATSSPPAWAAIVTAAERVLSTPTVRTAGER
jgi:hypothetical protein